MERTINEDTYLTSHEVAKMLQSNPSSINKWAKENRISAFRTPGGHRRFKIGDVITFLRKHGMPIPRELRDVTTIFATDDTNTKKKT
jgi:excisionase family DNA binding protein